MNNKLVIVTVIAAVAVAILMGAGFYFWQGYVIDRFSSDLKEMEQRIDQKISSMDKEGSENVDIVSEDAQADDGRIFITPSNQARYNNYDCIDQKFNYDEPNEYPIYTNISNGISISLPYNDSWGNDNYRINHYDEIFDKSGNAIGIEYGPIGGFEGCSWVREYYIRFEEAENADKVIERIVNDTDIFIKAPEKLKIGDFEVIKYEESGLCAYPYMIVIGEKNNYRFGFKCGSGAEKDFVFLEQMISRMSLR